MRYESNRYSLRHRGFAAFRERVLHAILVTQSHKRGIAVRL